MYKGPYKERPWYTMDRTKDGCLCVIRRRFGYWMTNLRRLTEAEKKLLAARKKYCPGSKQLEKAKAAVENRKKWLNFSERNLRNSLRFAVARITPGSDDYNILYRQCPKCRHDVTDLGPEPFASCKLENGKSELRCRRCYDNFPYVKVTFKSKRGKFGRTNQKLHDQLKYLSSVVDTFIIVKTAVAGNSMSDEAMEKMLSMTVKAINHFSRKSAREIEDAQSEAMLGLLEAAKKFDPTVSNKAKFTTYASFWIRRRAQARRASHCRPGLTLIKGKHETVCSVDTKDDESRSDQFHPGAASTDTALKFDVRTALEALPDTVAEIVVKHCMHGVSVTKLAESMNMSAYEVRKHLNAGKEILSEKLSSLVE